MSYNGSGTFLINSAGQPVVPGTTITTTAFNALTADLASGLTTAMTKDGQTVPTANIPMGGFKLTGLGAGTSATDAAQFGQLQNAPVATLITVAGADTITGTLVQTLTAYATGQQFSFVAAGTNTTAVTLNIDGLGAKAVTRTGAVALAAGALVSGQMAIVEYDGTRFQLINANAFTNLTVSGALTVGTTLAVTGVATLTAQPILSSLTASLPVFSDGSKGLVSNSMTGTGSVMMSASPTTTGTLTAAAINASGLVAMAGAATVGTTLGVTGTSTMAAINASGDVVVRGSNANDVLLTLGGSPTDNWSSRINLLTSTNQINWQISTNTSPASNGGFGITPSTSAGGSTFTTAAFKISNTGAVTIPGTLGVSTGAAVGGATPGAGGLAFPATAVAVADANTLDDYEEGTWTPTLTPATSGTITLDSPNLCAYTKIGRLVTVNGIISTASVSAPVGGSVSVNNLPFTSNATATQRSAGDAIGFSLTSGTVISVITIVSSTTTAIFQINASLFQLGSQVYFQLSYTV
jgi:hypothetical protein